VTVSSGNVIVVTELDKVSVNQTGITVTATVTNSGSPVSGETVTFSGDLTFSSATATTDSTGVATVTATAGTSSTSAAGGSKVSASVSDGDGSTVDDDEDFTIVEVTGVSPTDPRILVGGITTNSECSVTLTFTVSPAVSGVSIAFSFSPDAGGTNKAATMDNTSATTDTSGQATVKITSSDTVQSRTVQGTYQASSKTTSVSFDPLGDISAN
jgi:hypothetical protein